MKKGLVCGLLVAAVVAFTVVGCSGGGPSGGMEFVGAWQQSGSGITETVVFTSTSFSVSDTGTYSGTMSCSIQAVDTGARHIKMTVTSTTGWYTPVPYGTAIYLLYEVSGNALYLGMSPSSYPSYASMGPYMRQ